MTCRPSPRPVARGLALAALAVLLLAGTGCGNKKSPPQEVSSRPPAAEGEGEGGLQAAFDAYEAGRFTEARQVLEAERSRGNQRPELYSLLGLSLLKQGDLVEAERVLRDGRNRHPRDGDVGATLAQLFYRKGRAAMEAGEVDKARTEFQRAIAEVPRDKGPAGDVESYYREVVLGLLQTEEAALAIRLLNDYRSLGFRGPDAEVLRAAALQIAGRGPEALAVARRVDPRKCRSPECRQLYASVAGTGPTWNPAEAAGTTAAPVGSPVTRARGWLEAGRARDVLELVGRETRGLSRLTPSEKVDLLEVGFRAAMDLRDYSQAASLVDQRSLAGGDPLRVGLDRAELSSAQGDVDQARALLEGLQMQHPNDPRAPLELARFEARQGNAELAEEQLLGLLNGFQLTSVQEASVYELLGIVCAKRKDFDCAESWWLRLVGVSEDNCKAHYNLGTLYGQRGRYRESVEHLEKAIDCSDSSDPEFAKYLYWLALGYRQNGQNREMCQALEKLIALTAYKDPYHKRALEMRQKSGFCKVPEAVAGVPERSDHPLRMAFERIGAGNLRGAQEMFEQHLRSGSPKDEQALAHLGMGQVARRREQPAEAVVSFERALELGAGAEARVGLAEAYFELGLFDRSLEAWQKLRRRSSVPRARRSYEVARNLDRLGRFEEAMAAYEESISAEPDSLWAGPARSRVEELVPKILDPLAATPSAPPAGGTGLSLLAEAVRSSGDASRAAELSREAAERGVLDPGAPPPQVKDLLEAGDPISAEEALRQSLAQDPENAGYAVRLAEMVLERPEGLQEGFQLLMQARQTGGPDGYRATRRMIELYRKVGQAEDSRFLLEELATRSPGAPADLRDWAAAELAAGSGAAVPTRSAPAHGLGG